jgi:hypothetical protein
MAGSHIATTPYHTIALKGGGLGWGRCLGGGGGGGACCQRGGGYPGGDGGFELDDWFCLVLRDACCLC